MKYYAVSLLLIVVVSIFLAGCTAVVRYRCLLLRLLR